MAITQECCKQYWTSPGGNTPTRQQLYGHLPTSITKTIQVRRTRHAGHCWRSKDELISDVLLWTLAYGQAKARRPDRTYIQQLREDKGCSPEDLPEAMNDWEKWQEIVRDIRASGTTWWWWWWHYLNTCVSQKTCNILIIWRAILRFLRVLQKSWWWPTKQDGEILSKCNTSDLHQKAGSNDLGIHILNHWASISMYHSS